MLREQELRRSEAQNMGTWFQPNIVSGKSASILAEARPDQLNESSEERAVRMAYRDAEATEERRHKREQELYGHLSFQPQIDPLSRALGRETGITELSENPRGKALLERACRERERLLGEECSFRPRINELSKRLLAGDGDDEFFQRSYLDKFTPLAWIEGEGAFESMERRQEQVPPHQRPASSRINMIDPDKMARDIRTHLAEKEERRRAELLLSEIRELEGCTFRPSVMPFSPPVVSKPVVVRGFARHLELKNMTARQKTDRELREKEVFSVRNVDKFRRAEDGSTIVQVIFSHSHKIYCD
jgi:hypothetical protein